MMACVNKEHYCINHTRKMLIKDLGLIKGLLAKGMGGVAWGGSMLRIELGSFALRNSMSRDGVLGAEPLGEGVAEKLRRANRRFAVVRADQREEKAARMPPPADEGGPEARNRMLRAVGRFRSGPAATQRGCPTPPIPCADHTASRYHEARSGHDPNKTPLLLTHGS
jgi:hypothetical protein